MLTANSQEADWRASPTLWAHPQLFHLLQLTTGTSTLPGTADYSQALEQAGSTWKLYVSPHFTLLGSRSPKQDDVEYESSAPLFRGKTNGRVLFVLELPVGTGRVWDIWNPPSLGFFPFSTFHLHSLFGFSWKPFLKKSFASKSLAQGLLLQELDLWHSLTLQVMKMACTLAGSYGYLENHFKYHHDIVRQQESSLFFAKWKP